MTRSTYIAAALASFAYFLPMQAEAARCPQGSIYRPSIGVCQSKATAARAGIYKPRVAKASLKHRYKRPASMQKMQRTPAPPAPTPPWRNPPRILQALEAEHRAAPAPRPDWLSGVGLFDSFHAQAWSAQSAARGAMFGEN